MKYQILAHYLPNIQITVWSLVNVLVWALVVVRLWGV